LISEHGSFPSTKNQRQIAVGKQVLAVYPCHLFDLFGIELDIETEFEGGQCVVEAIPIEPECGLCV
jgi:hypothetical protein